MAAHSLAQGTTLRRASILVHSLTLSGASTGSQEMLLHFYCKQPLCPPVLPSRSAFHTAGDAQLLGPHKPAASRCSEHLSKNGAIHHRASSSSAGASA